MDARGLAWIQRSAGNAATVNWLRSQRRPQVTRGAPPVVRRKWLDAGTDYQWDSLIAGLQWYRAKATNNFRYRIRSEDSLLAGLDGDKALLAETAKLQDSPKERDQWVAFLKNRNEAVPTIDAEIGDVVPAVGSAPSTEEDTVLAPYLSGIPEEPDKMTFKVSVRDHLARLHDKNVDTTAVVATVKGLGVKLAKDSKMYCIENVLKGLAYAVDHALPFVSYILASLVTATDRSRLVADTVAYATAKDRLGPDVFSTVIKGVVFDIKRAYPRGFVDKPAKTAVDSYREFSADYRGLLGGIGAEIYVQGSAAIDVPGTVKDIDLAIPVDAARFDRILADVCSDKSKALWKVLVALGRKTGTWAREKTAGVTSEDIAAALAVIRNSGNGFKLTGEAVTVPLNAEMKSIRYCYDQGIWKHSDLLTNPQKVRRGELDQKWKAELNLEHDMDMSVIRRGGEFDKPPYLALMT